MRFFKYLNQFEVLIKILLHAELCRTSLIFLKILQSFLHKIHKSFPSPIAYRNSKAPIHASKLSVRRNVRVISSIHVHLMKDRSGYAARVNGR